jgi:small-conductance mechanosensitive channel
MNWNNLNVYERILIVVACVVLLASIAVPNVTASVVAIVVLMAVAAGFARE